MGFEGYPFTWSNARKYNDNIQCRIDRGVATTSSINRFSPIKVICISHHEYDLVAVWVDFEVVREDYCKKHKHIFRFEEVWSNYPKCEKLVGQLWDGNASHGHHRLQVMHGLDEYFKDYILGTMTKELSRTVSLLKEDVIWLENWEDIKKCKALEGQHNNIMKM